MRRTYKLPSFLEKTPTRLSNPGCTQEETVVDLIITNSPEQLLNLEILSPHETEFRSDHSLLRFDFLSKPCHSHQSSRMVYNYRNTDFHSLRNILQDIINLDNPELDTDDINLAWQRWSDLFGAAVDCHVPKMIRTGSPPWIDGEVLHLLHKKNSVRRIALRRKMNLPQSKRLFKITYQIWFNP